VPNQDDFYIIMGNSELRIKYDSTKLLSNFAVGNATFDASGFPRSDFLCQLQGNEVEM
jgi:hypothetical protein